MLCKELLSNTEIERWVIVFAFFVRAKIVNTTLALRTTEFLSKETEYMPWYTARINLNYFTLMFDRSEVYGPMQVCVKCTKFIILFNDINLKCLSPRNR